MGHSACTEPQCLYSTAIPLLPLWAIRLVQSLSACTVQLYLYSPYGPFGLYSTAIPLLPLWAVQPVQSLTACTVQLYLYSPQCLYSTAIPLLPSVPVQYSYTSTPPMGRTACAEPQYLYKVAHFTVSYAVSLPAPYLYSLHCTYYRGFV